MASTSTTPLPRRMLPETDLSAHSLPGFKLIATPYEFVREGENIYLVLFDRRVKRLEKEEILKIARKDASLETHILQWIAETYKGLVRSFQTLDPKSEGAVEVGKNINFSHRILRPQLTVEAIVVGDVYTEEGQKVLVRCLKENGVLRDSKVGGYDVLELDHLALAGIQPVTRHPVNYTRVKFDDSDQLYTVVWSPAQ